MATNDKKENLNNNIDSSSHNEDEKKRLITTFEKMKDTIKEEDPRPSSTITLAKIICGDYLSAKLIRRHIWLYLIIVAFVVVYVASRYQCQQDLIVLDKMETKLKDAKYKALSSSSNLTERCRESKVLEILKNEKDSSLHIADQPPYIINIPQ